MTLRDNITPQQLDDLRNRRITVRALAKLLEVTENHLTRCYPGHAIGKIPGPVEAARKEKKELTKVRREYRLALAARVIDRELTAAQAAKIVHCTPRTMFRAIAEMRQRREENPQQTVLRVKLAHA